MARQVFVPLWTGLLISFGTHPTHVFLFYFAATDALVLCNRPDVSFARGIVLPRIAFREGAACTYNSYTLLYVPSSSVLTYTGALTPVQFHLLVLNCQLHSSSNVAITSDKTTIARGTSRHMFSCVVVKFGELLHINSAPKVPASFRQQHRKNLQNVVEMGRNSAIE